MAVVFCREMSVSKPNALDDISLVLIPNSEPCADLIPDGKRKVVEPSRESTGNKNCILFTVESTPPWYLVLAYGLQQVIGMLGGPISVAFIIQICVCASDDQLFLSQLIATSFFMSGFCTILQVTIGVRLPIMQGSSAAFLSIFVAMKSSPEWLCFDGNNSSTVIANDTGNVTAFTSFVLDGTLDDPLQWKERMRLASGGVMLSAIIQMLLGCTGAIGVLTQYIGPLTLCPTITLIGLSLFRPIADKAQQHWGVAMLTAGIFIVSSIFMTNINVPIPSWNKSRHLHISKRYPLFRLFPQVIAISVGWLVCFILTETGQLPNRVEDRGYEARTDISSGVIQRSKWLFIPYPGMWGLPIFTFRFFVAMMAATISSILESIGDYYAAAEACGESRPPKHAINRGVAIEGLSSFICGLVGAGHATTSYTTPTALIPVTGMASRRTYQCAGIIIMLAGVIGKFGAILSCIPSPVLGGISLVSFAMISGLGLSYLSTVQLHSSRNMMVIGVALMLGIMIPMWMEFNQGAIRTGNIHVDQTLTMFLSTSMFVGGFSGFILDNLLPGTASERGLHQIKDSDTNRNQIYELPLQTKYPTCFKGSCLTYVPFLPCYVERDVLRLFVTSIRHNFCSRQTSL